MSPWPAAVPLNSPRLELEPLRVAHAAEMAPLLADASLYAFTGDEPPAEAELRARYRRQVVGGSPDGRQGWLNWVIRLRGSGTAIGTVQATLMTGSAGRTAALAWVVASAFQGRGYGTEAAAAMVAMLRERGVAHFAAYIAPDHAASAAIAVHLGLHATEEVVDGEVAWTS